MVLTMEKEKSNIKKTEQLMINLVSFSTKKTKMVTTTVPMKMTTHWKVTRPAYSWV